MPTSPPWISNFGHYLSLPVHFPIKIHFHPLFRTKSAILVLKLIYLNYISTRALFLLMIHIHVVFLCIFEPTTWSNIILRPATSRIGIFYTFAYTHPFERLGAWSFVYLICSSAWIFWCQNSYDFLFFLILIIYERRSCKLDRKSIHDFLLEMEIVCSIVHIVLWYLTNISN